MIELECPLILKKKMNNNIRNGSQLSKLEKYIPDMPLP